MTYYKKEGQMDLSDRIAIETGISSKDSFKKIGKLLHRHPSTIAHEIKELASRLFAMQFLIYPLSGIC